MTPIRQTACMLAAAICLTPIATRPLAAQNCNRACLGTMLDGYLNAVIAHEASAAPLSSGFRQTENAVVVRVGSGVWQTVTALGPVARRYFDPVSGQAGYFGLLDEDGSPAIATLRVRVAGNQITEAEWVISRQGDGGLNGPGRGGLFNVDNLIANPPPDRRVPPTARMSRETMVAVANSYFDGITTHDGSIIGAYPGCTRIENGVTVTGRQGGPGRGNGRGRGIGSGLTDCTSGLETINVSMVAARRYPLVDEEAGVVLAMVVFMRNPGSTARRNLLTEWFHLDGDRIRTIYAAMYYPPPEAPIPNWPPYAPNWPAAASFPTSPEN